MANHLKQSQIQTILAKTVSDLKPAEIAQLVDALARVSYTRATDGASGTGESTLATIFPSTGPNP
jgi:hypothetical protein